MSARPWMGLQGRLVQMAFVPLVEVAAWLARLGVQVVWSLDRSQLTWTNRSLGVSGVLWTGLGPLDRAPCLAVALAGAWWPQVFPGLLEAVDREAKRRAQEGEGGG